MTKIINVSKEPYEWQFDGKIYGPIAPGEIVDMPDEIANHAVKRSVVLDHDPDSMTVGDPIDTKVKYLSELSKDQIKEITLYPCSLVQSGQCSVKPFKTMDELRKHMESHWGPVAKPQAPLPASKSL